MRLTLKLSHDLSASLVCLAVALIPLAAGARQLNLPQENEKAALPEASRMELETAIAGGSFALRGASATTFMEGLPQEFRDSCGEVLQNLGGEEAKQSAQWTVRVLLALRTPQGNQALLALRCGSSAPGLDEYYDERPALVSLSDNPSTIRFIPLAEECGTCRDFFHHVEYSQIVTVRGGLLVELRVADTHNPCCDGGDEENKDRRVLLAVPDAQQVLSLDERVEDTSYDDSDDNGDSDQVCNSKIDYTRDVGGNVESIRSEMRCTNNNEPLPDVKVRTFRWNAIARSFEEQGAKLSQSLGH